MVLNQTLGVFVSKIKKTTFALWRDKLGLSVGEAAEMLGLSMAQTAILLRGVDGKGRPALPRLDTRKLMAVALAGIELTPVRLSDEETALERDLRRKRIVTRSATAIEAAA